jgi:hypothetical protein
MARMVLDLDRHHPDRHRAHRLDHLRAHHLDRRLDHRLDHLRARRLDRHRAHRRREDLEGEHRYAGVLQLEL